MSTRTYGINLTNQMRYRTALTNHSRRRPGGTQHILAPSRHRGTFTTVRLKLACAKGHKPTNQNVPSFGQPSLDRLSDGQTLGNTKTASSSSLSRRSTPGFGALTFLPFPRTLPRRSHKRVMQRDFSDPRSSISEEPRRRAGTNGFTLYARTVIHGSMRVWTAWEVLVGCRRHVFHSQSKQLVRVWWGNALLGVRAGDGYASI